MTNYPDRHPAIGFLYRAAERSRVGREAREKLEPLAIAIVKKHFPDDIIRSGDIVRRKGKSRYRFIDRTTSPSPSVEEFVEEMIMPRILLKC